MGKLITHILFNHLDYLYYLNDFFIQDDQKKTFTISYYNGDTLITTQTVVQGQSGNYIGETPTKEQDAQYTYTFSGWSESNDNTVDADVLTNITADKNVYACFTETVRTYTVTWKNGDTVLEVDSNVPYGTIPSYDGTTPTKEQTVQYIYTFAGWSKTNDDTVDADALAAITGDRSIYACFTETVRIYTVRFYNDSTLLETHNNVPYGSSVQYGGSTPVHPSDPDNYQFNGWQPNGQNITGNTDCYAQWTYMGSFTREIIKRTISGAYENTLVTAIGDNVFRNCSQLVSINLPNVTSIGAFAFFNCTALTVVILRANQVVTLVDINAFANADSAIFYVPDSLVDSYKAASNWSTNASRIKGISELPE